MRPPRSAATGFSLVELMVVVVILSILAVFGYSTYVRQVVKSNRAEARIALLAEAARQERYRSEHLSYAADLVTLRALSAQDQGRTILTERGHYVLTLRATPDGCDGTAANPCDGFEVIATAAPGDIQQRDEACYALRINQAGQEDAIRKGQSFDALTPAQRLEALHRCWGG